MVCEVQIYSIWVSYGEMQLFVNYWPSFPAKVYLSIRFYNSCRRLPETKRHSSLFLHWSGSKFLVVMAACTPSIHVSLGRPLFLLSSGIHSIINFGILSSGILLTWPYQSTQGMLEFWHMPRKTVYSFLGHKYRQILPKWNKFNKRTNTDKQQLLTLIRKVSDKTENYRGDHSCLWEKR